MGLQLPLGVGLPDSAVFATYYAGPNAGAVAAVAGAEPILFLVGAAGVGKTHLLQAACAATTGAGLRAALLPLAQHSSLDPAVIDGWDAFDLVCVDDVDAVAGDAAWEHALFGIYNALRARGGRWLAAGADVPSVLGFALPDLASRLAAGPVFVLQPLDDDGRVAALTLRAHQRGFELPEEVARYLLKHAPRDMNSLYRVLDDIDRASLSQQRKVTIPLLKSIL
ncbi:MAG: DnaA regulatory inactivator Hda [Gammaproteobacteria bacterium]